MNRLLIGCILVVGCGFAQDTLGPAFKGNNIEEVIKHVTASSGASPKSEFETTQQYEKRIAATERFIFVGPNPPADPNEPFYTEVADFKYDADSQTMSVSVDGLTEYDQDVKWFLAFTLVARVKILPSYMGENTFGVHKAIRKQTVEMFGIGVEGEYRDLLRQKYGASCSIAPDEARTVKPFLKVGFVVLCKPVIHRTHDHHTPTLSNPFDNTLNGVFVSSTIQAILIFDSRTGKVLAVNSVAVVVGNAGFLDNGEWSF
jgi:hypothetical protein